MLADGSGQVASPGGASAVKKEQTSRQSQLQAATHSQIQQGSPSAANQSQLMKQSISKLNDSDLQSYANMMISDRQFKQNQQKSAMLGFFMKNNATGVSRAEETTMGSAIAGIGVEGSGAGGS